MHRSVTTHHVNFFQIKLKQMTLLLKARAGFEPAFVGCMTIGCFYTENRASIVDLLEKTGRSRVTSVEDDLELTVQVLPGALSSLSPHSGSMSKLQNLTCGNRYVSIMVVVSGLELQQPPNFNINSTTISGVEMMRQHCLSGH